MCRPVKVSVGRISNEASGGAGLMDYHLALDIGAGSGTKIGLFSRQDNGISLVTETLIPASSYSGGYPDFLEAIGSMVSSLFQQASAGLDRVVSGGISSAGLLRSDGSFIRLNNLKFLENRNLPADLAARWGFPWFVDNDANCGALHEWLRERTELLYWVLGGGWGGAWVAADGSIRYPTLDWSGQDADLFPGDEPGYATQLSKALICGELAREGISCPADAAAFDACLIRQGIAPAGSVLAGLQGDTKYVRSEYFVSGTGRARLFALAKSEYPLDLSLLSPDLAAGLQDPATAGAYISRLREQGHEAAVRTDRVFGRLMGMAASEVLQACHDRGLDPQAPVILAGSPMLAHAGFLPEVAAQTQARGFTNPLILSPTLGQKMNPNLWGAATNAWNHSRH